MFYFNYEKYDFWNLYNCIHQFFPIGVPEGVTAFYNDYPGMKLYNQIIKENIYKIGPQSVVWNNLLKVLKKEYAEQLLGTTTGITSCFCGKINLNNDKQGDLNRIQELHFYISLLGQFYTVVGMDLSEIEIDEMVFRSTNLLIISPELNFKNSFITVTSRIEEIFKNFRFVPYTIYEQKITGLALPYKLENCTVFDALFNDGIDLGAKIFGDKMYKNQQWKKEKKN